MSVAGGDLQDLAPGGGIPSGNLDKDKSALLSGPLSGGQQYPCSATAIWLQENGASPKFWRLFVESWHHSQVYLFLFPAPGLSYMMHLHGAGVSRAGLLLLLEKLLEKKSGRTRQLWFLVALRHPRFLVLINLFSLVPVQEHHCTVSVASKHVLDFLKKGLGVRVFTCAYLSHPLSVPDLCIVRWEQSKTYYERKLPIVGHGRLLSYVRLFSPLGGCAAAVCILSSSFNSYTIFYSLITPSPPFALEVSLIEGIGCGWGLYAQRWWGCLEFFVCLLPEGDTVMLFVHNSCVIGWEKRLW